MNSQYLPFKKLISTVTVLILFVSTSDFSSAQWWRRDMQSGGSNATRVESVGAGGYQTTTNPMFAPQPGGLFTPETVKATITEEELQKLYDAKAPKKQQEEDEENDEENAKVDPLLKAPQGAYKLGFPQAEDIVKTMESEMISQIANRPGVQQRYNTWISYMKARTERSGRSTGLGGYNGICRLKWFEELLHDPIHSTRKTEEFSRKLHAGVLYGKTKGFGFMLREAREKMGVPAGNICETKRVKSAEEAYKLLAQRLGEVKGLHAQAIAPIKPEWIKTMNANMYNLFTVQANVGHTVNYRSEQIRQMLINLENIDYGAYYDAAGIMFSFTEADFLDQLLKLDEKTIDKLELVEKDEDGNPLPRNEVEGVAGEILMVMECPAGKILVGGKGDNEYALERLQGYCAIIDLGGNDIYREGMVSMNRPVLLIIDESGNDCYTGQQPAIQGSSILGVSCLIDRKGNDIYEAKHVAQGSTMGGVGILLDMEGDDDYSGVRRVQGTALGGIGLSIDLDGDDSYHAAMWAQGLGHPKGFGMLDDVAGEDKYFVGGAYPDSYPDTPGFEGWGQGLGSGLRDLASGGIGVLLDGGGDDNYEYDYIAHGGGYWLGVGILRDFSGNDNHAGPTRKSFNGGPRTQQLFQRLGNGFGCHYAVGYLFDDFGNDTYHSTIMNNGFGWDAAFGILLDFQGFDKYTAVGGGSSGNGAQASLGVLFDYDGDDNYYGSTQGYASPSINPDYHHYPECGGNFAFLIDYGGTDSYGCRVKNNGIYQRGSSGGYIVDRPVNPNKKIPLPK